MLLDTINIESQDIVKNIYIDNLLFVALRNPSFYDEDQEGGDRKKRSLTDKIQTRVMRDYQSISNTLSKIIDTTGQVKSRNLNQIQNLLDEISLTSSKTKKENMYVDLLIIISYHLMYLNSELQCDIDCIFHEIHWA